MTEKTEKKHVPLQIVLRSSHDEKARKDVKKYASDPRGHRMGLRRTEMNIENHYCHTNAMHSGCSVVSHSSIISKKKKKTEKKRPLY